MRNSALTRSVTPNVQQPPSMSRSAKFIFIFVVLILAVIAITNLAGGSAQLLGLKRPQVLPFSEVMNSGDISAIVIESPSGAIHGELTTGEPYVSQGPPAESPLWTEVAHNSNLQNHSVSISYVRQPLVQNVVGMLGVIALPLMLFALVYFLLLRPAQLRR